MTDRDTRKQKWIADLREAEQRPRVLVSEMIEGCSEPPNYDKEKCCICEKRTLLWLQPENAPLCSGTCLKKYIEDPAVYDPRGLYEGREPVSTKKRAPRKPRRWEPSEDEITEIQQRIASRRKTR